MHLCDAPVLYHSGLSPGSSAAADISVTIPSRSRTSRQWLASEPLIWELLLMSLLDKITATPKDCAFQISTVAKPQAYVLHV